VYRRTVQRWKPVLVLALVGCGVPRPPTAAPDPTAAIDEAAQRDGARELACAEHIVAERDLTPVEHCIAWAEYANTTTREEGNPRGATPCTGIAVTPRDDAYILRGCGREVHATCQRPCSDGEMRCLPDAVWSRLDVAC
jgi:hypothetical protein